MNGVNLKAVCAALAVAVVSAALARKDDIVALVQECVNPNPGVFWYGVYRDSPAADGTTGKILAESMHWYRTGNQVHGRSEGVGASEAAAGEKEAWKIDGSFEVDGKFVLLRYRLTGARRFGAGAYFLKQHPLETNVYRGYWCGVDSVRQEIVCFPYVLSPLSPERAIGKFQDYLNRPGLFEGQVCANSTN